MPGLALPGDLVIFNLEPVMRIILLIDAIDEFLELFRFFPCH